MQEMERKSLVALDLGYYKVFYWRIYEEKVFKFSVLGLSPNPNMHNMYSQGLEDTGSYTVVEYGVHVYVARCSYLKEENDGNKETESDDAQRSQRNVLILMFSTANPWSLVMVSAAHFFNIAILHSAAKDRLAMEFYCPSFDHIDSTWIEDLVQHIQNEVNTVVVISTARWYYCKASILKLGEYDMWVIRIKQYFQIQDYALWEVIENGDSWVSVPQTAQENGTSVTKMSIPVTAEEKTNKKNDVKAKSLLLMALPNEHQLTSVIP
ncbi:hypothetical protein Tco_0626457 [Tanacetum coccineum]|uniref:Uncharacterized protein n=1 Tax=Tanacetum coccineum TaxID=301880 RepID=A0ABQ4WJL4_9ASTR